MSLCEEYTGFTNFSFFFIAGKPKKENALKSLAIMLGPDYITDVIEV